MNLIGVVSIICVACLSGVAIFAYYADCDPMKAGIIHKKDQVITINESNDNLYQKVNNYHRNYQ